MAICRGAVELWKQIKRWIPPAPAVLEIGEANWYGDISTDEVPEMCGLPISGNSFEVAKQFYRAVLHYSRLDAVDMNGRTALLCDLNQPLPLTTLYDIVINTGTTEHVFDQRQVFETIHNRTRAGGLMIHCFPVAGCSDHGFYTYSPCLIRELAHSNNYRGLAFVERTIGQDKLLHLAWMKHGGGPFVIPQQGTCKGVTGGEFRRGEYD